MPAKEPMPVPATPTRWMRRGVLGSMVLSTFPSSFISSTKLIEHRVVKARAEIANLHVGAAECNAIGAQGDDELTIEIDPQRGAGETGVTDRAGAEPRAARGALRGG